MMLKIKVFDVGHGDCLAISFPNKSLGLVDSRILGSKQVSPALEYLKSQGGQLSFVCLTHPHADHYGGLLSVVRDRSIEVRQFWSSLSTGLENVLRYHNERSVPVYTDFTAAKARLHSPAGELLDLFDLLYRRSVDFDRQLSEFEQLEDIAGVKIACLGPSPAAFKEYERALVKALKSDRPIEISRDYANSISLVLLFQYGNKRVLLGGDATASTWREVLRGCEQRKGQKYIPVNFVKASHHGSSNSFCEKMWPRLLAARGFVVVSCGGLWYPSAEFVESIAGRWDVYCTNRGRHCHKVTYPEEVRVGLNMNSVDDEEQEDKKCFGYLDVEIPKKGNIKIYSEHKPNPTTMKCESRMTLLV